MQEYKNGIVIYTLTIGYNLVCNSDKNCLASYLGTLSLFNAPVYETKELLPLHFSRNCQLAVLLSKLF